MADNSFDCVSPNMVSDNLDGENTHQENGKNLSFGNGGSDPLIALPFPSDDEFLMMVERENEHLPKDDYLVRLKTGDLDLTVRKEAIDWIWKANDYFGFDEKCFVLAINYLDRFLSEFELPRGKIWTMQLLAVACLSLAAKMEEIQVTPVVDLQVRDPKCAFEAKVIQRMELLVLSTFKWRMQPYTPYTFIDYFLAKIIDDDRFPLSSLIPGSMRIILSTIKGSIDFLEFKPSEFAAAVALAVSGEIETADIVKAMSRLKHIHKGRVVKCLKLIDELMISMSVTPTTSTTSTNTTSATESSTQSPNGVLEAECLSYKTDDEEGLVDSYPISSNNSTSTDSNKRRKLDGPSLDEN